MKLVNNKQYLLLIDGSSEIKEGDYEQIVSRPDIIWKFDGKKIDVYKNDGVDANKIVAYYPLTKNGEEFDLALLPVPFEINFDNIPILQKELDRRAEGSYNCDLNEFANGLLRGYKVAQSKQFSLEDMIN